MSFLSYKMNTKASQVGARTSQVGARTFRKLWILHIGSNFSPVTSKELGNGDKLNQNRHCSNGIITSITSEWLTEEYISSFINMIFLSTLMATPHGCYQL